MTIYIAVSKFGIVVDYGAREIWFENWQQAMRTFYDEDKLIVRFVK